MSNTLSNKEIRKCTENSIARDFQNNTDYNEEKESFFPMNLYVNDGTDNTQYRCNENANNATSIEANNIANNDRSR